jgi:hypothetical protein
MKPVFLIKQHKHGSFSWTLKAPNNQSILYSDLYATKAACKNGILSVRKHGIYEEYFEKSNDKNGDPIFTLKASNGYLIGWSNNYSSANARNRGIESVMKHAQDAEVVELV